MVSRSKKDDNSNCKICNKTLYGGNKTQCCIKCKNLIKAKERLNVWLETGDLGISVGTTLRGHLRDLVFDYFNNKCSICGIDSFWNNAPLVLILDHIDGDASNNSVSNLRIVCPNCDSQLDTYKSKNKNSARRHRRK